MRMVRGALLAGIAIAAVALAYAAEFSNHPDTTPPEATEPRKDPDTRWETQEWPQRGQQAANLRVSTGAFTNAEYLDGSASAKPSGWLFYLQERMGRSLDWWPVIYGEPSTIYLPATAAAFGPHGLMAVGTDRGMFFITTVAKPDYPGLLLPASFGGPFANTLVGADLRWCGSCLLEPTRPKQGTGKMIWQNFTRFTGPPILFALPVVETLPDTLWYEEARRGSFFAWNATVDKWDPSFRQYLLGSVGAKGKAPFPPTSVSDLLIIDSIPATLDPPKNATGYYGSAYYPASAYYPTPAVEDAFFYVGTRSSTRTFDPEKESSSGGAAGKVTAYSFDMAERWSESLKLGFEGGIGLFFASTVVYYDPSTSPVASDALLVIGGAAMVIDKDTGVTSFVSNKLFALDPFLGATNTREFDPDAPFLWTYETGPNEIILPHPVILADRVIFGTSEGRAYALDFDGNLIWRTDPQIEFAPRPFTKASTFKNVELYGPAVDSENQFVYFGGNDGRVHQFRVQTGAHKASDIFWYYADGLNANGARVYRPCACTSAPAVYQDKFLVVKSHTQRGGNKDKDISCVMILSLPSMRFVPEFIDFFPDFQVDGTDNGIGCTASPPEGSIDIPGEEAGNVAFCVGTFRVGGIFMTQFGVSTQNGGTLKFISFKQDPITLLRYLNSTGGTWFSFSATIADGPAFAPYADLSPNDAGGVSISNGFVLATNRNGTIMGIPSEVPHNPAQATSSLTNVLQQPPVNLAGPLGPLRVYPNPFDPATAVGGVAKFKNLARGSTVTLYTLAYERVRVLHELNHEAFWDGRNEAGQDVATGVYLYKIIDPEKGQAVTGRLALTRK